MTLAAPSPNDAIGVVTLLSAASRIRAQRTFSSAVEMAARLSIDLDPWQDRALSSTSRQLMFNVTRQGGKSTTAALLALHEILAHGNRLVLAVSPTERQSKLLLAKLLRFYRDLDKPVTPVSENILSLRLSNGSEVYALPGDEDTIRGFSAVDLLLVDEAARVDDDLIAAVRPMLAVSGGRLVTMSTPWGKRGWWWHAWAEGGDDWERYEVPATACPRIPAGFLAQERRALPHLWYASEYECAFIEPDDAAFSYDAIQRAFDDGVPPLFPLASEAA